jgi:tripartite-type tricarboxylate transporter receptor subunit TctC
MTRKSVALALLVACASVETGAAQIFPARAITIIVPLGAGTAVDLSARIVSEHMSRTLGRPVVVDNIVGAGGTIGTTRAMRADPNGYTIEMGHTGTHAYAVALHPTLAYKPDVDFEPISIVNVVPMLIVARKDFPPKNLKEFVHYVKLNFDQLNMAHNGVGSGTFTTCLLLNSILNVKPTLVPFTGLGPINALVGGQVDYMCGDVIASVPPLQAGMIKAYAVGTTERNPMLPDVPTSKEAGLPEFQASIWHALFAPKATPKPILDQLADALDKALDDENTRKRLLELGTDIPDKTRRGQQQLAALVKSEIAKWTPIIKAAAVSD